MTTLVRHDLDDETRGRPDSDSAAITPALPPPPTPSRGGGVGVPLPLTLRLGPRSGSRPRGGAENSARWAATMMPAGAHFDLLIRGGACVLPWGIEDADIGVRDGRIAAIGVPADATAEQSIDARGLHVLPGLIDAHVHLREPGDAAVETIATGTRAAVLGGITSLFDMPNTNPAITDADRLAWKQAHVEEVAWCDMGLYVGAAKSNIGRARVARNRARRVRHKSVRRQLDRRSADRGRRKPRAGDARRASPHRLSQRG